MAEQLCPVCQGRGGVPQGFYATPPPPVTSTLSERCQRCGGVGTFPNPMDTHHKIRELKAERDRYREAREAIKAQIDRVDRGRTRNYKARRAYREALERARADLLAASGLEWGDDFDAEVKAVIANLDAALSGE